ncbi:MAG: hypothetical protein JWM97_1697 [Phycisphaerales bacterium]|nr:hypothetical protein [Phycisphaerales bacterium]
MPSTRLTFLSAISLMLTIATGGLWLRSTIAPQVDFFNVISANKSYGLGTEHGGIIGYLQLEKPTYRSNVASDIQLVGAGFRYLRITSDGMRRYNLALPFWLLTMVWAIIPCVWMSRRMKAHKRKHNRLCQRCGYDLRASSDCCPECGTAIQDAQ